MLPSLLVGAPSKNQSGRPRMPVGPPSLRRIEEVMRCLRAGSSYLSNRSGGSVGAGTREERDRLLAEAEVILGGWPFPLDLRARAPRLKWFHQRPAGASNLLRGDLWGSDVIVTTSRGVGSTLAMAEYALAGILYFAKSFDRAQADRGAGAFEHRAYRPLLIDGKTACVVGAGGIGRD